jgi:hypothetical protein
MTFDGEQNYPEAAKWYRLSAAQGNGGAQVMLGNMYFFGHGVARNYVRAMMWFSVASDAPKAKEMRQDTYNYWFI